MSDIKLGFDLTIEQTQKLVMTPELIQAIQILQFNTQELNSVSDLKGKTIYATGKGSTPEYFLRYVLTQNGIDPDKDVDIQWKSEPSEVVALLNAEGKGIAKRIEV